MCDVMELQSCFNPSIDDGLDELPQDIDNSDTPGVRIYFLVKYHYSPYQISWEGDLLSHVIHQSHLLPQCYRLGRVMSLYG